jgi:hypothetical protein
LERAVLTPALIVSVVLTGCADAGSSTGATHGPSEAVVDEVASHDGRVCPQRLPQAQADHGFGTAEAAESAPTLPAPESAWVCQYSPKETGYGEDSGLTWVRFGDARPVHPSRLPVLERELSDLAPAEDGSLCPADLGPRWLLVYSHGSDLTGVAVDDFGCRDVRLTDEPFSTVPGDATQPGLVPGVLTGPPGLLAEVKALHGIK